MIDRAEDEISIVRCLDFLGRVVSFRVNRRA